MSALIEATGMTVKAGAKVLLEGVDLRAQAGEIQALVGPNGAGKTTLLKALLGLIPHEGQAWVSGTPMAGMSVEQRAQKVAYVPQFTLLTARVSGWDVVAQGRFAHGGAGGKDREIVQRALIDTDCEGLADRPFAVCSGGERSRLLLARALATEAPLLLLDEPTASLDMAHALHLYGLLKKLTAKGKGIVVVQHQLSEALRWSDKVLVLNHGKLVASGSTHQVMTPTLIEEVFGLQVRHDGIAFDLVEGGDAS